MDWPVVSFSLGMDQDIASDHGPVAVSASVGQDERPFTFTPDGATRQASLGHEKVG